MQKKALFGLGILCSFFLLTGCSGDDTPEAASRSRAALVTATGAVKMDVPQIVTAVGTVEPSATVTVVSRVSGELMETHVYEGEYVEEGQLLFVIDKRPSEIALMQSQARLDGDRARLAKARDDLNRSQQLTKGGFASAAQNDEARVTAEGLRADVKASEAAVAQAELNLSYCEIRAPMAGRAGAIMVDKGNMIAPLTQPLLTIDAHRPVDVTFAVPERYILQLRGLSAGNDLKVTAQPKHGKESEGVLTFVGNVDTSTGTVQLKARFTNANAMLWPGEFVRLRLQLDVIRDAVAVPSRSVVIGPEGTFVYVITPDMKAEYRLVRTGIENDGLTVISSGLEEGEQVALEGHVRLADGIDVRFPQNDPGASPASQGGAS